VAHGCCGATVDFDGQSKGYRQILWLVIALNAVMFAVEIVAGALAGSQALLADALDFAGDTATYALSLFVIGMPLVWRSRAALFKSASLTLMGVFVLGSTLYQTFILAQPNETVMGVVGVLALAANVTAALLLMRYRDGDANVRSVWLCSRNDAIGNVAVTMAAVAVGLTGSAWPDLIVAFAMASLFLRSAWQILQQSLGELRHGHSPQAAEQS
jgi:cation diffusion facilitator family transporter